MRELLGAANRRYLAFLSQLDKPDAGLRQLGEAAEALPSPDEQVGLTGQIGAGLHEKNRERVTHRNGYRERGWQTVSLGASSGDWERGVPVDDPAWAYDPARDHDGSGQCFLTQNELGNTDVDGGATALLSPRFDLSVTGVAPDSERGSGLEAYWNGEDGLVRIVITDLERSLTLAAADGPVATLAVEVDAGAQAGTTVLVLGNGTGVNLDLTTRGLGGSTATFTVR